MKEQLEQMLARAHQALKDARLLSDHNSFEASVSRAYYAMFYTVEALFLTQNLSASSHNGTISLFGLHFVKPGLILPKYGRMLGRAFDKRQISDYKYSLTIDKIEAEETLNDAIDFVQALESWLKNNNHL